MGRVIRSSGARGLGGLDETFTQFTVGVFETVGRGEQVLAQGRELVRQFAATVIPVAGECGHAVGETRATHGIRQILTRRLGRIELGLNQRDVARHVSEQGCINQKIRQSSLSTLWTAMGT
ncbi:MULTISPECIES: hypothetical protein [unclassified Cryobacterium]|uniref:hypothetical protein n=1 Tax=unclassified Cryobacterium TaxID=2649013 RepID=UPI000CE2FEA1|nr:MULTISPECIES: hypothetical protein [unclassified Cryobacterium]